MADIYVKSGAANSSPFASWANAATTLAGGAGVDAAGDTIYLSQSHAESSATSQTISLAGTLASPVRVLCGNDGATPPTSLATTAVVETTGASSIAITGVAYFYGVTFKASGNSSSADISINGTDGNFQEYDNCVFDLNGANAGQVLLCGSTSSNTESTTKLTNCSVKFSNASQAVELGQTRFSWVDGGLVSGTTTPTAMVRFLADGLSAHLAGLDLSTAGTGLNIFNPGGAGAGRAVIVNSKLPASWVGGLVNATPTAFNTRCEMHNCDSGDTNYRLWIEDYAGTILNETTIVRTGGASDGTTTLSWKMVSTANAEYPLITLDSPEIVFWGDTTGSSKTATIHVVTDNVTLTDAECWLEVQYLGTSGFPLGSFISDAKADVLASAANQATSTETWTTTGLTTPVKQKLEVTFTPQEKGYYIARVRLAKASTTVYVCPKLEVA